MSTAPDTRPLLELERNNAGRLFIGITEFDGEGRGVRAAVLCHQDTHTAESIMRRRFADMVRLMGANVRPIITEQAKEAA